jgi:cysteine desulfurase
VLVSTIEHHAILESAEHLEARGATIEWLEVDRAGRVDPQVVADVIARDPESVSLVSVMLANNEIGTVQPIARIAQIAHAHGIPVHTDAVQALGQVPVDFAALGVDALSITAHKVGGPVGVGALVLSRALTPVPVLHGGGQERSVRSGTLDVAGAAAFAHAAERAAARLTDGTTARMAALRDRLAAGLLDTVPDAVLTGGDLDGEVDGLPARLPGNVHVVLPGCEGASLLFLLDAAGFATSTGSACQAGVARPSHVLLACGFDEEQSRSAQRFTLGPETTQQQVDALLAALPEAVERSRQAGLVGAGGAR